MVRQRWKGGILESSASASFHINQSNSIEIIGFPFAAILFLILSMATTLQ